MHEHDQEIIMALAEGTLDDDASAAASAEIGSCPECSSDLELQRMAIETLDAVPTAYLTATESAQLHRTLRVELAGAPTPPVRAKSSFAWGRWLPAVGIAAVFLVAIVSVPSMFGGGDDDSADMTVASPETTAASTETRAAFEAPATADDAGDGALQESIAGADTNAADDQEIAAAETTAAPAETTEAPEATTTTISDPDVMTIVEVLPFLGEVAELDRVALLDMISNDEGVVARSITAKSIDPTVEACLLDNAAPENASEYGLPVDSDGVLIGIVTAPTGEELVLVAYVPEDINETVFVIQQISSCEIVAVLP